VAVFPQEETAEVVSLSAGQVARLLGTLDLHRQMLQVGHEDARRLALSGLRPGYLLDFELIFRYVFRSEERPDWARELQFLFDHGETTFLIGPGTQLEIERFIRAAGFFVTPDGATEDLLPSGARDRKAYGLDEDTVRFGLARLSQLLAAPNVKRYGELTQEPEVDNEAFETAKAALDTRRRGEGASDANLADALNWAAVVYLRRHADVLGERFHPYLLTATRPLLDEGAWSADIIAPVSRRPSDAIYTEVLLDTFSDPAEAANHTVEVAFRAAALDRELRRSPAYLNPQDFQDEPEWERALEQSAVGSQLQHQLQALTEFINDPVVTETQRIYDNAYLTAVGIVQQRGDTPRETSGSPRKLFDLIVEVSAALQADTTSRSLASLWKTVLDLRVTKHDSNRITYQLVDHGPSRRLAQYLVTERYTVTSPDSPQRGDEFALRWPSSLNAADVIDSLSRAFQRHDAKTVDLIVGTDRGVRYFGAEIPFTLSELIKAVQDERGEGDALHELFWVRMGSDDFDLYADITPPRLTREPVVGVFVDRINPDHLVDLYVHTAGRYVLPAWLRCALEAIGTTPG
jgi:hypothetical protein